MKKLFLKSNNKAFTLIELLVVVAIIGILSTVVIASLNSAREKGKIATIKSTLKQLYNQAALNQLETGSFAGSNTSYSDLTCTGPNNNLAKIAQPLIDQGIIVKCFSWYGSSSGLPYTGDNYLRFGATALIYDTTTLKAWSVDENGVVKWDLKGVNSSGVTLTGNDISMAWATANTACATNGGKLPSVEQARTLSHSWYQGSGNTTYAPLGFIANYYWASTTVPSSPSSFSYLQYMLNGALSSGDPSVGYFVRCVR